MKTTHETASASDTHVVAQAVHDLGTALWFGGSVMGVAGVNKSGADLTQGSDRIRVAASAWGRFQPAQWGGVAATLLSGLQLTASNKKRLALQKGYGTVGALKAALTVGGAGATAYAAFCGSRIAKATAEAESRGEPVVVEDATKPSSSTPPSIAKWQRQQRLTQFLVPTFAGGVIVCNAWLVQSYRAGATAKGVVRRFLPIS